MEIIILDPSKSKQSGISFAKGPIHNSDRGMPILKKVFFNAECQIKHIPCLKYNKMYSIYFNSLNYYYQFKIEILEELFPGKIIFFKN